MPQASSATAGNERRRIRLLYRFEAELEPLMFLLAIAWLWLFIVELLYGLEYWQQRAIVAIWIAFIAEFLLKLYLAPRRFAFRESRRAVPRFTAAERKALARIADRLPERELRGEAKLPSLLFHVLMALRHPAQSLKPLWRNKAVFLPLSLPGLATAAFAPSFLLVFTAEIWDVGLGMSNAVASGYASLSILAASLFLARVQSLFLPRRKRNVLTEHLAVANTTIFLSIFLACVGLFLMVAALMLVLELFVFPADLMQTWPTLDQPRIDFADKLRLSAFIATIGVSTGALAGGLESRAVIRHLALFEDER